MFENTYKMIYFQKIKIKKFLLHFFHTKNRKNSKYHSTKYYFYRFFNENRKKDKFLSGGKRLTIKNDIFYKKEFFKNEHYILLNEKMI